MTPPLDAKTTVPAERHQRAGELFLDALEREPATRLQFLAEACGPDREMLSEVISLLQAQSEKTALLDRPVLETASARLNVKPCVLECPTCGSCMEWSPGEHPLERCPNDGAWLETAFTGNAVIDGKYRVEHRLGRGGMGAVYRVRHVGLDKLFALKLILSVRQQDKAWVRRFEQEAKALGKLKHSNIIDVTDYGVDPRGFPYLVTELLHGKTLAEFCQSGDTLRPVPIEEALPLLDQIASAIDFVHANGIVHRDLKLGNVFLADVPKLMDFGLAAIGEAASEQVLFGTPHYMAPELLAGGAANRRSDVYAAGVIVFAMLTGRMPFDGSLEQVLAGHRGAPPPTPSTVNPALPPELDAPLVAMLAKKPDERPSSVGEAVRRIRQAWLSARRRGWKAREIPRRLWMAALVAMLGIAAAGIAIRFRPIEELDLRTVDARFAMTPRLAPDRRILLVLVDEPSLAGIRTPLADVRTADEFGATLERMFDAGARSVALDFMLPEIWSRSRAFSQMVLRHSDRLTLGLYSSPEGQTVGAECVQGLVAAALEPARLDSLFAFVNVDRSVNGTVRRGRTFYSDRSGNKRLAWAAAAVREFQGAQAAPERFWIDYSVDPARFMRVSWKDAGDRLVHDPALFRGRVVLIGGDYAGSGDEGSLSPATGSALSGIVVQAIAANTVLSGFPLRDLSWWFVVPAVAILCVLVAAAALLLQRMAYIAGTAIALPVGFTLAAWLLFRAGHLVVPALAPLAAVILALAIALLMRRVLPRFPAE